MSEPLKCICFLCDSEHSLLLELSRQDALRKYRDFASSRPVLSGFPTALALLHRLRTIAADDDHQGSSDSILGELFRPEPNHDHELQRHLLLLILMPALHKTSRKNQTPNLVRFEARREHDNLPAITVRDLLKASLRHRSDRILLGEIRGAKAFDLLQMLNTGHSGTISTVHANCSAQALSRFTSCVLQSGVDLPYRAIKTNIADSLNLLIHLERRPGRRFVSEVAEIAAYKPDIDRYELESTFVRPEDQSDCQ